MSLRVAILTISDRSSRGEREDLSGPAAAAFCTAQGWQVVKTQIVPDDMDQISHVLMTWADAGLADVILTSGGTGFAPRDVTPEATRVVLQKLSPGIDELIRAKSMAITPRAALSRAVSGIRARSFILNLPGSPKAVAEILAWVSPILPHAVDLLQENPPDIIGH